MSLNGFARGGLWEELGSAGANLLSRRKIVGHEPNYGGDRYFAKTPFPEISLQRFQNELKKIVKGATSFNVHCLDRDESSAPPRCRRHHGRDWPIAAVRR
jgi:hypothetical protein